MTPDEVTWISGDDHGLVWPDGLALVDGRLELSVAEQLWSGMSAGSDLAGFLDGLSSACGGLLAIPDFAIGLRSTAGVHFAVRGDFRVHATDAVGEVEISGSEAVTWSERLVPGAVAFTLYGRDDSEGDARRLTSGVVPAGRLTSGGLIGLGASGQRDDAGEDMQEVEPPFASADGAEPAGRVLEAGGMVVGVPVNEDLAATALPDDLGITRIPDGDLVTPAPGELDADPPLTDGHREDASPGVFEDLWGATVARSVEEAAVRNAGDVNATATAHHRPADEGWPPVEAAGPIAAPADASGARADLPVGGAAAGEGCSGPAGQSADSWWRSAGGLITGVPKGLGSGASGAGTRTPHVSHGDHDGETIGRIGLEGGGPSGGAQASLAPDAIDVPAIFCGLGHPNPPQSVACRICREAIPPGAGRRITQPVVGRIRASTGATCELIGMVVVGRKPGGARGRGVGMPQLLVIAGYPHVSSNHLEIRVDGWAVFARDLGSLNGTFLRRRGEQPSKLTEPIPIYNGDILDLGHGASVAFEDMP